MSLVYGRRTALSLDLGGWIKQVVAPVFASGATAYFKVSDDQYYSKVNTIIKLVNYSNLSSKRARPELLAQYNNLSADLIAE